MAFQRSADAVFGDLKKVAQNFASKMDKNRQASVVVAGTSEPFIFEDVALEGDLLIISGRRHTGEHVAAVVHYSSLSIQLVEMKTPEEGNRPGFMSKL